MQYPDFLHVDVTEKDILNGIPENEASCPIALAARRMFPDATVSVDGNLDIDGIMYRSERAMAFVTEFDFGEPVEPQIIYFEKREY